MAEPIIVLKTSITYSRIWKIAYPIILGSIAQNIINVTDTAFLGRVSEVALGAVAVGGIFYIVFIMLGFGFGIGTQIIVARRNGEGKFKTIGLTMEQASYFMMPLALLIFIFLEFFSDGLLRSLLSSDAIFDGTKEYIDFRAVGIIFAFFNLLFRAFFIGIAKTKVITWSTIVLAIVNIFLDYCLIFGNLGFPEMGIAGAAIASVIAEFSASLFFVIYTFMVVPVKKYNLFAFHGYRPKVFFRIFKVASPIMLQHFLSLAAWFSFFLIIEKMGERPLAISNIIRSFYVVLMIPIWGFSSATNTLVSYIIGMKRPQEVMAITYKVLLLCFVGVLGFSLISVIIPEYVLMIYTDNMDLIMGTIPVLYVVSGAAPLLGIGFILFSAVSGTGKTQISLLLEILTIIIYLTATYILVFYIEGSISTVWLSEYIYAITLGLFSWGYMLTGKWRKGRI